VLFAPTFDIAGTDVGVIALERLDQVLQRQAVGHQAVRDGRHQEFLDVAADAVDLGHPRYGAQLRLDDPVLDLAQIHGRVGRAVGLAGALLGFDGPLIDLAQPRGDGPHDRPEACRQAVARLLDALVDQLAGKIDIGPVLENHRHLRQPIARQRACAGQARQPGHHGFDGESDALFGLQGGVAGRLGIDLDLDVGDVGHGIDGQALIAPQAQRSHGEHGEQDDPALLDGESDNAFEHGGSGFSGRGWRRSCRAPP
jgi:hypothetical protein